MDTGKFSGYVAVSGVQFCSSSLWINSQFTAFFCAHKGNGESFGQELFDASGYSGGAQRA